MDEGSSRTYVSRKVCDELRMPINPIKTHVMLLANGSKGRSSGLLESATLEINKALFNNLHIDVSDSVDYDILLGRDLKGPLNIHSIHKRIYMILP